jgi:hypothetical protein
VQASTANVRSGTDGRFRMTIDKKYEQLATYRTIVAYAYLPFVLLSLLKVVWMAAPFVVAPGYEDHSDLLIFGFLSVGSILTRAMAGMGTGRERFWAVMAFNIFTLAAASYVRLPPLVDLNQVDFPDRSGGVAAHVCYNAQCR